MDNVKNDRYYIAKILENAELIIDGMKNKDISQFSDDPYIQAAMMFFLIQISENAKEISDEMQDKHPEVPWSAIYGLRNRIVHDYGHVSLDVVFNTLKDDIPKIVEQLENI